MIEKTKCLLLNERYGEALACELQNPATGLAAYEQCACSNRETIWSILLVPTLTFPVSYVVAYYATAGSGGAKGVLAAAVICLVGAGPMWVLVFRQYKRRGLNMFPEIPSSSRSERYLAPPSAIALLLAVSLFGPVYELTWMLMLTAFVFFLVVALPIGIVGHVLNGSSILIEPDTFPFVPGLVIFWAIFAGVFLIFAADPRPPLLEIARIVRQLPWGLKAHWRRTASFLGNIALLSLLAVTVASDGVLYLNLPVGILAYAAVGALLGGAFFCDEMDPLLGSLIEVGKARCRFQTGERLRADYELWNRPMSPMPPAYGLMADALLLLIRDPLGSCEDVLRRLNDARRALALDERHREFCLENIARIENLARGGLPVSSQ